MAELGRVVTEIVMMVQQPSPVGSGPVDLGQLLRQLMPIEDEASEIGQPMPGAASADNGVSGNAV